MLALLCHCRHRLEAEDDEALRGLVKEHLVGEHPAIPSTDEQVREIVATRAYDLQYKVVYAGAVPEDEVGPEPF